MLRILFTLIAVSTVILSASAQGIVLPRPVKSFMKKEQPTNKSMAGAYRLVATTQLDSDDAALDYSDSTTYVYNSDLNSNVDSTYVYEWTGSSWEPQALDVSIYNTQGQVTAMKGFFFAGPAWEQDSRTAIVYDANGNILEMVYEEHDGSQWDTTMKMVNMYQNNKVVTETMFMDQGNGLEALTQTLYLYNAQGLPDTVETQMNFGGWMGMNKAIYTYNTGGKMLTETKFNGDFMGGFEPTEQSTYSYDTRGNLTLHLTENWEGAAWANATQTYYQFNTQSLEMDWLMEQWDGNAWQEIRQGINYFTGTLLDSTVEQQKVGSNWENKRSASYAYDAHGNQTLFKAYEWFNGGWEQTDETRNYYEPFNGTGIGHQPQKLEGLSVYPNPIENVATFSFTADKDGLAALAIYDLMGRQIFAIGAQANAGQNTLHWDASSLPSGSYIYKIKVDGKVASGVLVK